MGIGDLSKSLLKKTLEFSKWGATTNWEREQLTDVQVQSLYERLSCKIYSGPEVTLFTQVHVLARIKKDYHLSPPRLFAVKNIFCFIKFLSHNTIVFGGCKFFKLLISIEQKAVKKTHLLVILTEIGAVRACFFHQF